MELQNSFIPLYKRRSINDKMGVTFELIKMSWKPFLKYMIYLLLPCFVVQAICVGSYLNNVATFDPADMADSQALSFMLSTLGWKYFVIILVAIISSLLFSSLIFALIKCYSESDVNEEFTSGKFRALLIQYIKKMVILFLFSIAVFIIYIIIIGLIAAASTYTLWITVPISLILTIPLGLFTPIYLFEDISIFKAFRKCFRIGFPTWGGTFVLVVLNGIIGAIVSFIIGLPYLTIMAIRNLISSSTSGEEMPFWLGLIFFIFCLLSLFGSAFGRSFVSISLGYQYGHATQVTHSIRVEDDLEHMEE